MSSFEAITGPKADRWLVRTTGILITVIGAVLLADGRRPKRTSALLAGWSATGLAAIEIEEVARGRISAVYLLDALLELAFVAARGLGLSRVGRSRGKAAER